MSRNIIFVVMYCRHKMLRLNNAVCSSETSLNFCRIHGVISQKAIFLIVTAFRTSIPKKGNTVRAVNTEPGISISVRVNRNAQYFSLSYQWLWRLLLSGMSPCSLIDHLERFRELCCIPLQGRILLRKRKHHIPPKRSIKLHDVISQKTLRYIAERPVYQPTSFASSEISQQVSGFKPRLADGINTQSFVLAWIQKQKHCFSQVKCNTELIPYFTTEIKQKVLGRSNHLLYF